MKKTGLSVAAGVILIILAVLHVLGGLATLACGGLVAGASSVAGDVMMDESMTEGMTEEQKAEFQKNLVAAKDAVETGGGGLAALAGVVGLVVLVIGVLEIVCAVGVFGLKAWAVSLTLGVMGVGVAFGLYSLVSGGFSVMTVIGIALNAFVGYAVFASKDDGGAAPAVPAAPAGGAPPPAD